MKKLFIKLTACVVVSGATFAVAYVSYLQNVANLPDVLSANVEALARIELPEIVVTRCDTSTEIAPEDDYNASAFPCDKCETVYGITTSSDNDPNEVC